MKKIYLLLLITLSFNEFTFSQSPPLFSVAKNGVEPVVLPFDSTYKAELIYNRAKEWIQKTYENPKFVLKADVENSYLRIEGFKGRAWMLKNLVDLWYDISYILIIEIKDSRCRVTFSPGENTGAWFKKDGTIRPHFEVSKTTLEHTMNEMLISLYNQIKGAKNDNW